MPLAELQGRLRLSIGEYQHLRKPTRWRREVDEVNEVTDAMFVLKILDPSFCPCSQICIQGEDGELASGR